MKRRHGKGDRLFLISGQVRVLESGAPVSGVVVKAYDKDLFFDDLLGAVETEVDGSFSIICEGEDFREFFETSPDLYLKVTTHDRCKVLFSSEDSVRPNAAHEEYFDITIPQDLLQEDDMGNNKQIGQIALEIDAGQLKKIAEAGRLEEFAEKAAALFALDLKSELVAGSTSSVNTKLVFFDNDEFGTGPRPPHWHNIGKIDNLQSRISALEKVIALNAGILESKDVIK
jgi:hypothetical protein